MSVQQALKALATIPKTRLANVRDLRYKSPKALGDYSGLVLNRIGAPSAQIQDINYEDLYALSVCNDLVWSCINIISSTAAQARLVVRRKTKSGVEYLPDHPLQRLLDFPNASMTQRDLIQSYAHHRFLFGTIGMVLYRDGMEDMCDECLDSGETYCTHRLFYNYTGEVKQIMPVHPENFKPVDVYKDGVRKTLFTYTDGRNDYPIHPDNVITDPFYNTNTGWYGVSPTHLVKNWINLDMNMTQQITMFYENGGIPSMLVNVKPPDSTSTYEDEPQDIINMLKENWMTKYGRGAKDEKTPAFVYGDIVVQQLNQGMQDLLSKELYDKIEARICKTYGVPPNMFEFGLQYGSQKASTEQMDKSFYTRTIAPELSRFKQKIENLILPTFNDRTLEVTWDLSDMGIANFLQVEKESAIERRWEKGLFNRNKTLMMLGEPTIEGEIGDEYFRRTVLTDANNTAGTQLNDNQNLDNKLVVPSED